MKFKSVILLSGGLDSSLLLLRTLAQRESVGLDNSIVSALGFDYGQTHMVKELEAARNVCDLLEVPLDIIKLPNLVGDSPPPGAVIPARNLIFAATAVNAFPDASSIAFGFCLEDREGFLDCREDFMFYLNETLTRIGIETIVYAPFIDTSKAKILEVCASTPRFKEVLALSYSCYFGEAEPCGECGACLKRNAAISVALGSA